MAYIEYVELEKDIRFHDRQGRGRCFFVKVVLPMLVHEEELLVQVGGDPEFKLILRDSYGVTSHDMESFLESVKTSAVAAYKRFIKERITV